MPNQIVIKSGRAQIQGANRGTSPSKSVASTPVGNISRSINDVSRSTNDVSTNDGDDSQSCSSSSSETESSNDGM